ncbi:MAG: Fe-S cluster assembly ATPase SufC [Actinobacteria bacterium]|nr:MAG: Fe-S cluster assembly ATPase SufC [Actinomycetota bacterium]
MSELVISGLEANVRGTPILRGVDLVVRSGEVHAVMGPNGSGKSTLAHVLMGKPGYEVTSGSITLDGVDLVGLAPWQRARAGLFLGLQYPVEVPGVHVGEVLVEALAAGGIAHSVADERIAAEAPRLGLDDKFFTRALNVDLSGGEKKRVETFQLAVLRPKIAILDELDSGLDIDALRLVSRRVEDATKEFDLGVLAITHYQRLLEVLHADHVHIFANGRIKASGGPELAFELERTGYAAWADAEAASAAVVDPFAVGLPSRGLGSNLCR